MKTRAVERGSALFMTMLVTMVLAAVAMVVVGNVVLELSNAGAARTQKQAYYLGEAGLAGPIAQAAANQGMFLNFLQTSNFVIYNESISSQFFDYSTWGSFGPEYADANTAGFVTYFSDPVDTQRIPGYSTTGYCYRRYTVTSDGQLGLDRVAADNPASVQHTAQSRFISHVYLGPFQCGM